MIDTILKMSTKIAILQYPLHCSTTGQNHGQSFPFVIKDAESSQGTFVSSLVSFYCVTDGHYMFVLMLYPGIST